MSRTPREALREIRSRLVYLYGNIDGTFSPPALKEICGIAEDALAEPARNCDVHTGWLTALKKFNDTDGKRKPWGDDVFDTRFLDWLFALAAERKGE